MRVPWPDFTVNTDFPDAPCDQLRVLRTEIQNQDTVLMDVVCHALSIVLQIELRINDPGQAPMAGDPAQDNL
jgi:hypothetical protein